MESKGQLGQSFRRSTGPLYSQRELATTEKYLAEMGITKKEDNRVLGARIYSAGEGKQGSAVIYLDEVGAHPNLSGTMVVTTPDGKTDATVVWDFAKKQSIAHTKNPILRKIRQTLSL